MQLLEHGVGRRATLVALAMTVGLVAWLARPAHEPHRGRVVVTESETTILDVVGFEPGTATLLPGSRATLDAVAETLTGNPSLELVEVQSHTSGRRNSARNLSLSQQRAEVVVTYLVAAGVASSRLVAQGYGDTQPIDCAAPAKNERVSFLILKRTP